MLIMGYPQPASYGAWQAPGYQEPGYGYANYAGYGAAATAQQGSMAPGTWDYSQYSQYYAAQQQPESTAAAPAPPPAPAAESAAPPPPPAAESAAPPPPPADPEAPPPGVAPPSGPPPAPPPPPGEAPAPPAAASAPAPGSVAPAYDSQAYAQWYQAQQYAGYHQQHPQQYAQYGYPYAAAALQPQQPQQSQDYSAYWHQQQQQHQQQHQQPQQPQQQQHQQQQQQHGYHTSAHGPAAAHYLYGAAAQATGAGAHPGPRPPKGPPPAPAATAAAPTAQPTDAFGTPTYNQQPPPSNLYLQQRQPQQHQQQHQYQQYQQQHLQQAGAGSFLTGTNNVPLGGRKPPAAAPGQPFVIKPQLPQRPAYVSVGTAAAQPAQQHGPAYNAAASGSHPSSSAAGPNDSRNVSAAVAAAAAAAAVAARQAQQAAPKPEFPPSFTGWVTRCFNTAKLRGIEDSSMSAALMEFLNKVKAEGRLWTTDWDTHPVLTPGVKDVSTSGRGHDGYAASPALGRKRHRWGMPSDNAAAEGRTQDADTDEEDHGGRYGAPSPYQQHPSGGYASNRGRKRLTKPQVVQQQQQHPRGRVAIDPSAEERRRRARAGRFGDRQGSSRSGRWEASSGSSDMETGDDDDDAVFLPGAGVVVGTCQELEKSYFRLTGVPEPSTVRPEAVLEKALARLVGMLARREATFFYALDQFKGLRQDCTVQHLRNGLACRVYEAHARNCLEYGDLAEFNQCQARLGNMCADPQVAQQSCRAEFLGYRLLYEAIHIGLGHGNMAKALLHTMRNVPPELVAAPEVRHAQQVREAILTHNYAAFFRLYATAPNMGRSLMDGCTAHMRWYGLNALVKACDLPVPVAPMAKMLGFAPRPGAPGQPETVQQQAEERTVPLPGCAHVRCDGGAAAAATEEEGTAACTQWLREHGAVVVQDKGGELSLDTKASRGKLFIPEPPKVSHGDDNLSLTDFMARAQKALTADDHDDQQH